MSDDEWRHTMLHAVPEVARTAAGAAMTRPAVAAGAQRIGMVCAMSRARVRAAHIAC
ncbi:MAG: hypothetical protein MUD17_10580 [Gemmatimonadaceae bacterium]|nr:hypothetical protein [Gemmatimonadaceae bacterium]